MRQHPSIFLVAMFLILVIRFEHAVGEENALERIQIDLSAGKITEAEAVVYQFMAIRNSENLPQEYRPKEPFFSRAGTTLKAHVKSLWPTLSASQQEMLQPLLQRPTRERLPDTLISPNGRFKIHYTTSGNDAATYDFIQETAATFDYVYDFEVGGLGYRAPLNDSGIDGPEIDVYIYNYPGYGETEPANPSWIEMDNDFSSTPTKGIKGMSVTAAHEFFHMIQLAYHSIETTTIDPVFLFECSAVWMEDVVFDDINDYYNYLPSFFRNPELPFHLVNGTHEYGLSIFCHMLEQKYGQDIIRRVWEEFVDHEPLDAFDRALIPMGSNFPTELAEFAVWNCFTNSQADTTRFYPEGRHYPAISANSSYEFTNSQSFSGSNAQLASRYFKLKPLTSGDYVITPTFSDPSHWRYSLVYRPLDGEASYTLAGNAAKALADVRSLSEVWVISTNIVYPESNFEQKEQSQFSIALGGAPKIEDEILFAAPNPFMPSVHESLKFRFRLAKSSKDVHVVILNEHGERIRRLKIGPSPDGLNEPKTGWDGKDESGKLVTSGVYLYYIEADQIIGPAKMALVN